MSPGATKMCQGRCLFCLVWCGRLHVIDDEHRLVLLLGYELEPELLLHSGENVGTREIDVGKAAAVKRGGKSPLRCPIEIEVEEPGQAGLVHNRPSQIDL